MAKYLLIAWMSIGVICRISNDAFNPSGADWLVTAVLITLTIEGAVRELGEIIRRNSAK